jgi:hypothetical protein
VFGKRQVESPLDALTGKRPNRRDLSLRYRSALGRLQVTLRAIEGEKAARAKPILHEDRYIHLDGIVVPGHAFAGILATAGSRFLHGGSVLLRGFPVPARLKQWAEKPLRGRLGLAGSGSLGRAPQSRVE